jgi:hypothetical protein
MRTNKAAYIALAAVAVAAWTTGCIQESPTSLQLNPGDKPGDGSGGEGNGSGTGNSGTGNTGNGGPGASAMDFYVNEVHPLLLGAEDPVADCSTCHINGEVGANIFMTSTAEGTYAAIEGNGYIAVPENSKLVLHGVHTGPALSPTVEAKVIEWLLMEVEERGLAGGTGTGNPDDPPLPVGQSLTEALAEFGDCMSYDDWLANNLDGLDNAQANQGGTNYQCRSCHTVGDGGAWLGLDDMETFEMNRTTPYVFRLVTGTVDENGAFESLVAANRYIVKGQAECPENFSCHPEYTLNQTLSEGVTNFVALTLAKMEAGECEPPPPAP